MTEVWAMWNIKLYMYIGRSRRNFISEKENTRRTSNHKMQIQTLMNAMNIGFSTKVQQFRSQRGARGEQIKTKRIHERIHDRIGCEYVNWRADGCATERQEDGRCIEPSAPYVVKHFGILNVSKHFKANHAMEFYRDINERERVRNEIKRHMCG